MDDGNGCTLWIYLIPLNYILKMVKMIDDIMYPLPQFIKLKKYRFLLRIN